MCRKVKVSLELQEVLDKLAGKKKVHKPVKYSGVDILAAKTVLTRLQKLGIRNEISCIRVIPKEINLE